MSQSHPRTASLESKLGAVARSHGVSSVVVADQHGLPVVAGSDSVAVDEVAALSALRANGDARRSELVDGKVKARRVDVGDQDIVLGAVGDTAICAAVFDEVEEAVRSSFS